MMPTRYAHIEKKNYLIDCFLKVVVFISVTCLLGKTQGLSCLSITLKLELLRNPFCCSNLSNHQAQCFYTKLALLLLSSRRRSNRYSLNVNLLLAKWKSE